MLVSFNAKLQTHNKNMNNKMIKPVEIYVMVNMDDSFEFGLGLCSEGEPYSSWSDMGPDHRGDDHGEGMMLIGYKGFQFFP